MASPTFGRPQPGQSQPGPARGAPPPHLPAVAPAWLPPAPPTPRRLCTPRPHAQACRTRPLRARAGRSAVRRLAPRALSGKGAPGPGPCGRGRRWPPELHFQRRRWVRSPSEASYGSREPGRTDWAARVMPRDPRVGCRVPSPSSRSLSLFPLCLASLGPQLASAGTFRALKEPLPSCEP